MKPVISTSALGCMWTIARSILLLILVLTSSNQMVTSQEVTNEPFLLAMPSLIENDSCTPPCWFGLQAGESPLEDVLQMFSDHPDLFYNELVERGQTEDGLPIVYPHLNLQLLFDHQSIGFFWSESHFVGTTIVGNVIRISDGRVAMMAIKPPEVVSLSYALNHWGQPDLIRAGSSLYYDFLLLYYREPHLIVQLDTEDEALTKEVCEIADLMDAFRIEHIYYLSPITYREEARSWLQSTSYVPSRVWNSWTAGEIEDSCTAAISSLRN